MQKGHTLPITAEGSSEHIVWRPWRCVSCLYNHAASGGCLEAVQERQVVLLSNKGPPGRQNVVCLRKYPEPSAGNAFCDYKSSLRTWSLLPSHGNSLPWTHTGLGRVSSSRSVLNKDLSGDIEAENLLWFETLIIFLYGSVQKLNFLFSAFST